MKWFQCLGNKPRPGSGERSQRRFRPRELVGALTRTPTAVRSSQAFLETARSDLSRSRRTFVSSRDMGVPVRVGRAGHPEQRAGSVGLHPDRESVQNEFETAEEVLVGFLVCGFFVREHLGSEHRRGLRKPFRVDKML